MRFRTGRQPSPEQLEFEFGTTGAPNAAQAAKIPYAKENEKEKENNLAVTSRLRFHIGKGSWCPSFLTTNLRAWNRKEES